MHSIVPHAPRAFALGTALAAGLLLGGPGPAEPLQEYHSPYSVRFTHPVPELIGDIERGPRGDPRAQAAVPHAEWYSPLVRKRFGAWGPPARHYAPLPALEHRPAAWKRERVLATALLFQGYGYQHHHVPEWHPPADWPWKQTCVGHNGKGVDCSNFTAFGYNLAFGYKPSGDVKKQSEELEVPGPGEGRLTRVERIDRPATYAELVKRLRTGDLLYVRNRSGEVSHVVLWVGPIGHAPDGAPLIIDSHGEDVKDSNGVAIPCGIRLRPFHENSWYYHSASHAHRIFRGE